MPMCGRRHQTFADSCGSDPPQYCHCHRSSSSSPKTAVVQYGTTSSTSSRTTVYGSEDLCPRNLAPTPDCGLLRCPPQPPGRDDRGRRHCVIGPVHSSPCPEPAMAMSAAPKRAATSDPGVDIASYVDSIRARTARCVSSSAIMRVNVEALRPARRTIENAHGSGSTRNSRALTRRDPLALADDGAHGRPARARDTNAHRHERSDMPMRGHVMCTSSPSAVAQAHFVTALSGSVGRQDVPFVTQGSRARGRRVHRSCPPRVAWLGYGTGCHATS